MPEYYNKRLKGNAQSLRKNMTKEERHLWYDFLKGLPVMVHRQKVFGNYIADFYIAEVKLVIELDGSQHYEETGQEKDARRDQYFESLGLRVLRVPNNAVTENFRGVCEKITQMIEE